MPFDVDRFLNTIEKLFLTKKALVIGVSEGIKTADGNYVFEQTLHSSFVDAFGHKLLNGTAAYLARLCSERFKCSCRAVELSTLQRCAGHMSSRTDITEAYQVGGTAVSAAFRGETGKMVILKRVSNDPYICVTDLHDIDQIANLEKKVPLEWILENGEGVTEEALNYIRPLIQAELSPIMITGQPRHIVVDIDRI